MPSCYQLFHKDSPTESVKLTDVDEAICHHLNMEVDPVHWCYDWHNCIGFILSTTNEPLGSKEVRQKLDKWIEGYSEEARKVRGPIMQRILKFLEDNYSSTSWYETSRR